MIRVMMMLTYISPLLDLDLGDVLDGDLEPVPVPHPGVHDAEPTLAKDRTNLRQNSNCEEMEEGGKKEEGGEKRRIMMSFLQE